MNKKLGVLFIHGMGATLDDFAHDAIQELRNRISGKGLNRDDIAWESVFWAPILGARETQLWVDLSTENDLNWAKLRKFFINGFGNATAYQEAQGRRNDVYGQIHGTVHEALRELREKLGGDKPLIVIAHSLGSVIMSNYIWDRQKGKDAERFGTNAFERMETLAGLITLGTNIPLFTLAHDPAVCIEFPPSTLAENLKKKAKWFNFYDSDDVLAWPLKPLSINYADTVSEDIEVSVGNILTAWNPANHAAYWTDDSVIKPAAYLIASILEECQARAVGR
jgi:pimeloyl-ACP methyl ester carboxylesterase